MPVADAVPKYEQSIPAHLDPFDPDKLNDCPLSGEEIFPQMDDSDTENTLPSPWSPSDLESGTADLGIAALTHGFEDNFVDKWSESDEKKRKTDLSHSRVIELDNGFEFDEDDHAVFKTVPGKYNILYIMVILFIIPRETEGYRFQLVRLPVRLWPPRDASLCGVYFYMTAMALYCTCAV